MSGDRKVSTNLKFRWRLLTLAIAFLILISPPSHLDRWQQIVERGYLLWGTRPSLLTYYSSNEKVTGIEYLLLKKLTDANDIELKTLVFNNNTDMFTALDNQRLDIVGGFLSITPQREQNYQFSSPIDQSKTQIVVHSSLRKTESLSELKSKTGEILSPSSYSELFSTFEDMEAWNITLDPNASLYELIERVNNHEIDFTFADSKIFSIYSRFFPRIRAIFDLSEPNDIAFMGRKTQDYSVFDALDEVIENASTEGIIYELHSDIEQSLPSVTATDTVTFIDHYNRFWPQIQNLVYTTAEKHQIDPMLLGAISYQESHWKPDAISFTGVEGLMMLTKRSAEELGVEDRTNPEQSLDGGVRYFLNLKSRIPRRIQEPDRTYLALVAYNIGFGNMEQARVLTQRGGKNPDSWDEVNDFLPFLNDKNLSKQLKWGNADGKTAVDYVNNIITYRNLLQWKEQKTKKTGP
ncbi:membrane-bound lytic murein transglycosylase MltF [Marinicella sp. W31]|uniref:membrane-bound lytic murein transglycosylase MltF n=1 Tax=Marinicella sp. W31 TaxID=3023713 RepID=UPI0037571301